MARGTRVLRPFSELNETLKRAICGAILSLLIEALESAPCSRGVETTSPTSPRFAAPSGGATTRTASAVRLLRITLVEDEPIDPREERS
jgi:hypothetical protein